MKLGLRTRALVIGKAEERSRDGQSTYYRMSVAAANAQAGTLNCTKEAYDKVVPMKEMDLSCVFDDKYNSLRVTDAILAVVK